MQPAQLKRGKDIENYVFGEVDNYKIHRIDPYLGQINDINSFKRNVEKIKSFIQRHKIAHNRSGVRGSIPDGIIPDGSAFEFKTFSNVTEINTKMDQILRHCQRLESRKCYVIILRPTRIEFILFNLMSNGILKKSSHNIEDY